ncbi:flagellar protein FlhE [Pluralibacter gergoviae]|nr:flagellar protein FlhE [Pluralibacter gergoviae]ELK5591574.1 flagellar protein FlhE [Pluralibacter gergoviae]MDU4434884.1 flagellar protein FlhE [Pluralibacter gergoviae]
MRALLAGLMLLPLSAAAAGEGAWQASAVGVTLHYRGQSASSAPLASPQPVSGLVTTVAWRYTLNGPTPAGLRVRLCSQTRCTELDAQSGTTRALENTPAAEPLRFVWEVPGGGRLIPALNVASNQLIVNYR